MDEREVILKELWRRLAAVSGGGVYTTRNAKAEPKETDFPAIQFFELEDTVLPDLPHSRGGKPAFKRKLRVAIESYISATTEGAANKELYAFIKLVKTAIYQGDGKMGLKIAIVEVASTRVLRPPVGGNAIGLGLFFDFIYVEDVGKLFP